MPDVAKLKKKAAEFELKKQFDKALATYVEILDSYGRNSDEEVDLALYNRVGDLFLKQGNVADAVDYYEQAVDRYAEGGFFNNAIALCNKILRNSPGRASVYYKLGKISAHKGFKGDAKANFLEYADRMQQVGKIDESFRALKEFADLCPDQDDIRLMLADQLSKKGRGAEAIEQLQLLHERYTQEGRDAEAGATIARMKAIDPASEPRSPGNAPRRAAGDLVFLDLNDASPEKRRASTAKRATQGLSLIATGEQPEVAPPPAVAPAPPVARAPAAPPAAPPPRAMPVPTPTPIAAPEIVEAVEIEPPELMDFVDSEPVHVSEPDESPSLLEGLESTNYDSGSETGSGSLLDFEPTDLGQPIDRPASTDRPASIEGLGDALLDFEMPVPAPARPSGRTINPIGPPPRPVAPPPRSVAPPPRPSAPIASSPLTRRPTFDDLPMLDDGLGTSPANDDDTLGGDLELIMPEEDVDDRDVAAARLRTPAGPLDDIPLMDLDLPIRGEAMAHITGAPVSEPEADPPELEMIDFSSPSSFEVDQEPVFEVSAAELDVRADLDLAEEPAVSSDSGDFDRIPAPPRRSSTMLAAQSVELLQALVNEDGEDNALRRRLGEAMLESGNREGGLRELEAAMVGYERAEELGHAASLADEIVLLNPGSVRHHQKRVEYAFRTNERGRLIEAYLQLADALFRAEQVEKSRAIYQRVIDLSPDDLRAQEALQNFPEPEPEPAPPPPSKGRLSTVMPRVSIPVSPAKPAQPAPVATPDDEFVNLGDWLRDDEAPKDTRMVVEEQEPTGDEEADFQDMLRKFKQGIAENVEEEDHQSHYDLGVAYKEMGLLDEAIAEFQKALRAPHNRVSTYEALGQCFIEKEQYPMAATVLQRALAEKGISDDQLVGVLYLLGLAAEARGQNEQALEYYQRVFVVDIQFRDVGERLAAVEGAGS